MRHHCIFQFESLLRFLLTLIKGNVDKFNELNPQAGRVCCKFAQTSNMSIRFNSATLDKIEKVIEESGYIIRYERGTFQSGYCILESKKVVVLNKFLQTESRINTLIDLLPLLTSINPDHLSAESKKMYLEVMAKPA